jgi:membrane associated rhomboid family serine protease
VGISWQGHLFGGIGGVLAAYWLDQRPRATVPGRRVS